MVSFFSKKKYLVDLLDGFTDIHNHILPGIDDGSPNVDTSIELIQGFTEFGVNNFIMTPHIMHNYYENTPATINGAQNLLHDELVKRNLHTVTISSAAEHMIDSNFESILDTKSIMTLGEEHLLVEMSYLQPPINFDESIIAITHNRLFPVLAHPERYNFLLTRSHRYTEFKEQGILFQLNMLSLSDYYGKEVGKTALKLLEEGMIDFIGSDVHNTNHLNALKKITLSNKTMNLIQPIIENTISTFSF
ncbi:MAG: tyrosine-protein phosphatase [Maribacter sp.]